METTAPTCMALLKVTAGLAELIGLSQGIGRIDGGHWAPAGPGIDIFVWARWR